MLKTLKNHADTVIVLGGILSSVLWMNGKFNKIDSQFKDIEKEVAIIKTVLIIKGIMPPDLIAKHDERKITENEKG